MEIMNIVRAWIIANLSTVIPIMLFLIFCLFLFCLFLAKTVEVLSAKIEAAKIMKRGSLEDFLEFAEGAIVGTFDQAAEINEAANFVSDRLNSKNVSDAIYLFRRINRGRPIDLRLILKRAFLIKGVDFWVNVYFMAFLDQEKGILETMKYIFKEIYDSEPRKALFTSISRELQRYEANMLHAANKGLAEAISTEIAAIKEATTQEEFPW